MIKTYYVDSENVGDSWIDLPKEDYESSAFAKLIRKVTKWIIKIPNI